MKQNTILAIAGVLLAMQVAAVATNRWSMTYQGGSAVNYSGLWEKCVINPGDSVTCGHLPPAGAPSNYPERALWAIRALSLLSVLLFLVSTGLSAKGKDKWSRYVLVSAGVSSILASLLWWNYFNKDSTLSYSYYMSMLSGVGAVLAGLM